MDGTAAVGTGTTWARADHVHPVDTTRAPIASPTFTGTVTLPADPAASLQAATKQYVDATNIRYRNRIINGDMSVDQRNGGSQIAMPATAGWAIDRWRFLNPTNVPSKGTCQQFVNNAAGMAATGCLYAWAFATTTAYAPAAGDIIRLAQFIEGYNFLDANWGTASAQPIVVEFWANAPVAGTYATSLVNAAGTRSYVSTFTLAANTWTKVRVNVPGDTTGTWSVATNASMFSLNFPLCVGSTSSTATLNAWQAGAYYSATGAVNVLATTSSGLNITGVALMVGAAAAQNAEPEFKKYSDNLIDCQRYYVKPSIAYAAIGNLAAGQSLPTVWTTPAVMRGSLTIAGSWSSLSNATAADNGSDLGDHRSIRAAISAVAAGVCAGVWTLTSADADF
jgi:hypothetical protein